MARQMPRSGSNGISRKLTIVALGGVLCVATFGTAAAAGSWRVTGPTVSVVQPADVLFLHSVSGHHAVRSGVLNSPRELTARRVRPSVTKQSLIMETARRAAAAAALEKAALEKAALQNAALEKAARQTAQLAARQAPTGSPQQIAQQMLGQYGWAGQFSCLDSLWTLESGWNIYAENPATGAYGIPQALPGAKMASAGPDWQSNPVTQIRWGLDYIQASYGSPCAAWSHEETDGWY